jgi:hypothetical protein
MPIVLGVVANVQLAELHPITLPRLGSRVRVPSPPLDGLEALPPMDLELAEATASRLSVVAGGLSLALAHTIRIIDPGLKAPHADDWERAFSIFDLLF